jgi:peroxiredoxin family protein
VSQNTVVLVTRNGLGSVQTDDQAFGVAMFDKFIHTLESSPEKPQAMCFYTEGVYLACEGSPALLGLQLLRGLGVRIVVCQTCLEHYGLKEKLRVGEVGGMTEIVSIMNAAEKVLTV